MEGKDGPQICARDDVCQSGSPLEISNVFTGPCRLRVEKCDEDGVSETDYICFQWAPRNFPRRSMNWKSCGMSKISWLKKAISISWSRGASIWKDTAYGRGWMSSCSVGVWCGDAGHHVIAGEMYPECGISQKWRVIRAAGNAMPINKRH
jgi:hypothetical protein